MFVAFAAFMYLELFANILHNRRVNLTKYYIISSCVASNLYIIVGCEGHQCLIPLFTRLRAAGMIAATSTSLVTR